jgi:hypothetical protein
LEKNNLLLCRSHYSCAKCIIDIGETSGKNTMSKVLSKCFQSHFRLHYSTSLEYPTSLSAFSKSSNRFLTTMKNFAIPLATREHQPIFTSFNQFFKIITNLSKFSVPSWHRHKLANIPTMLNMHSVSIWKSGIPKIWQASNAIVGNCFAWSFHHCKGNFTMLSSTCLWQ